MYCDPQHAASYNCLLLHLTNTLNCVGRKQGSCLWYWQLFQTFSESCIAFHLPSGKVGSFLVTDNWPEISSPLILSGLGNQGWKLTYLLSMVFYPYIYNWEMITAQTWGSSRPTVRKTTEKTSLTHRGLDSDLWPQWGCVCHSFSDWQLLKCFGCFLLSTARSSWFSPFWLKAGKGHL